MDDDTRPGPFALQDLKIRPGDLAAALAAGLTGIEMGGLDNKSVSQPQEHTIVSGRILQTGGLHAILSGPPLTCPVSTSYQ